MVVWASSGKKVQRATNKTPHRYLVCWRHKSGGNAVCANAKTVPLDALTTAIIEHFRSDVLTPERIAQVARDLADDAETAPERVAQRRAGLEAELRRLESRLAKLTEAVAEGGSLKTLTDAIRQTEGEHREVEAKVVQLDGTQALLREMTTAGHQGQVQSLLTGWQDALAGSPIVARQILRKLLVSPITIWPEADGSVHYEAQGSYARLLRGVIGGPEEGHSVTIKRGGVKRADDLAAELKALASAQPVRRPDGMPGPTS